MALLSLSNISKSYGTNKVFENVSFTIEENHRIGFVGINGSGKTTLFKIICDQLSYDEGEIFKSKALKIGYVEQFVCKDSNISVLEELLTIQQELIAIENEIETLQQKIENITDVNSTVDKLALNRENLEDIISKKPLAMVIIDTNIIHIFIIKFTNAFATFNLSFFHHRRPTSPS